MMSGYRWLDRDSFLKTYGEVYENSPWIAEQTYEQGALPAYMDVSNRADDVRPQTEQEAEQIAHAFAETLQAASTQQKLTLIRAHPDLVGKAAIAGGLGKDSTLEQASAGLDQCSADEFNRFQDANTRYWAKFEFPFVMAVRGADRQMILAQFEKRLDNQVQTEFENALVEINKIARLRIVALI